jgi:hypothetical protein
MMAALCLAASSKFNGFLNPPARVAIPSRAGNLDLRFVFSAMHSRDTPKVVPPDWPTAVSEWPDLASFELKALNSAVESTTVVELYTHRSPPLAPHAVAAIRSARLRLEPHFPVLPEPPWFSRDPTIVEFLGALASVNLKTHPGFPCILVRGSKGEIIRDFIGPLFLAVCYRWKCVRTLDLSVYTPVELYQLRVSSPSFMLLKNEVAKVGKNPRVIEAVSLIDYVVEHLACSDLYSSRKHHAFTSYSAIGIGFSQDDSDAILRKFRGFPVANSDVPKFDMTVDHSELINHAEFCAHHHGGSALSRRVHRNVEEIFAKRLILFSDGAAFEQVYPGGQASGRFGTSHCNTFCRAIRSQVVSDYLGFPNDPHLSAGDDNIEVHREGKEAAYAFFGFPLRDYSSSDGVEFCSHVFSPDSPPYPKRIVKAVATILLSSRESLVENFEAFVSMFTLHPDFPRACRFVMRYRWESISGALSLAGRYTSDSPFRSSPDAYA